MSEIEFNIDKENSSLRQPPQAENEGSGLIRFLLKKGIVKNVRQADIFLSVFVILTILISIFIFYFFSGTSRQSNLTPQESNFFNSEGDKKTTAEYDATLFGN